MSSSCSSLPASPAWIPQQIFGSDSQVGVTQARQRGLGQGWVSRDSCEAFGGVSSRQITSQRSHSHFPSCFPELEVGLAFVCPPDRG